MNKLSITADSLKSLIYEQLLSKIRTLNNDLSTILSVSFRLHTVINDEIGLVQTHTLELIEVENKIVDTVYYEYSGNIFDKIEKTLIDFGIEKLLIIFGYNTSVFLQLDINEILILDFNNFLLNLKKYDCKYF